MLVAVCLMPRKLPIYSFCMMSTTKDKNTYDIENGRSQDVTI